MLITLRQLRKAIRELVISEALTLGVDLYKNQMELFKYSQAPARGYTWISPDQIENERSTYVPFRGVSVAEYREILNREWNVLEMEKALFSSTAQWGHQSLVQNPEGGGLAMPLDWSIMFDEYKKQIEEKIQNGIDLIDSGDLTEEQEGKIESWIIQKQDQIRV